MIRWFRPRYALSREIADLSWQLLVARKAVVQMQLDLMQSEDAQERRALLDHAVERDEMIRQQAAHIEKLEIDLFEARAAVAKMTEQLKPFRSGRRSKAKA